MSDTTLDFLGSALKDEGQATTLQPAHSRSTLEVGDHEIVFLMPDLMLRNGATGPDAN